jgi:hypothetical protein
MAIPVRLLSAYLTVALPVLACSCRKMTVCELIVHPTVFIGEVVSGGITSLRQDPWNTDVSLARFTVLENLRGLPADTKAVDIELRPTPGMCSPVPYFRGHKYLVAPNTSQGRLMDGDCFQGFDLDQYPNVVRQVREFFAGRLPPNLQGRVFGPGHGPGITISASRAGKTYSTVTRPDGSYLLPVPEAGVYSVLPTLAPYSAKAFEVGVPPVGCGFQDLSMMSGNSIRGTVRDRKGRPVIDARVALIDLDHPQPDPREAVWYDREFVEKRTARFTFNDVAIGRYLLISNPDGPNADPDAPYEPTFYPLASSRGDAQVIEIKHAGTHLTGMDLVLGKPVTLRKVVVKIHFPDGAPMYTAKVYCTGLPTKEGDLPWLFNDWTIHGKQGIVRFSAPSNRKLHLELEDVYRRPLKTVYSSTHEPGISPIRQEFVVEP